MSDNPYAEEDVVDIWPANGEHPIHSWPTPWLRYVECVETGEHVLINDHRFITDKRPCKLFGGELVFEGRDD